MEWNHVYRGYSVRIRYDADSWLFIVDFADIPDMDAFGTTHEEACENACEAIDGYIEACQMLGLPTPHSRKRLAFLFRISDFIMCWVAVVGLAGAALGVASFANSDINIRWSGQPVATPMQKIADIAGNAGISIVGFTYMLWRYRWRYRLSTLMTIAVLWFVAIAALATAPTFATAVLGVLAFAYVVYWTSLKKGEADEDRS